ncbi:MAG: AAA family ATPase [Acidobacteriota bacterium]
MYLDYWSLSKNPFDSVPDPQMYFTSHCSVESTVAELLFAIEEGNECLAVVVGEVGLGKTMSLRVVLNELNPHRFCVAFVTNPDLTFPQLLREIIGQLQGQSCQLRGKDGLLEEFNRVLFEVADSGRKVLIFIDEGNALRSCCLEGLRLLTNMQEDARNLLTIVLAGQPKLARMLEDRRRTNLFQRIGVYSHLEPLESVQQVREYVDYRLSRAGATREIFEESAIEAVSRHSDGIPRLINRLCKLSLKAGETNGLESIGEDLVEDIASRFDRGARARYRARQRARARQSQLQMVPPEPPSVPESEETLPYPALTQDALLDERFSERPLSTGPHALPSEKEEHLFETMEFPTHQVVEFGSNGHAEANERADPPSQLRSEAPRKDVLIPSEVIEALRGLSDEDQRLRLAGQLAARQIQEHPEHYSDASIDPVRAWDQLRLEILRKVS